MELTKKEQQELKTIREYNQQYNNNKRPLIIHSGKLCGYGGKQ